MKIGQDPMGKFTIARSLYKTILRYVCTNHGLPYVVQPLAPNNFSVEIDAQGTAHLSWSPQTDRSEPTAQPTSYILYTAMGKGGFDNGQIIKGASCSMNLKPGELYTFKVAALNSGGESLDCQQLPSTGSASGDRQRLPARIRHGTRPWRKLWIDGRMEW